VSLHSHRPLGLGFGLLLVAVAAAECESDNTEAGGKGGLTNLHFEISTSPPFPGCLPPIIRAHGTRFRKGGNCVILSGYQARIQTKLVTSGSQSGNWGVLRPVDQ